MPDLAVKAGPAPTGVANVSPSPSVAYRSFSRLEMPARSGALGDIQQQLKAWFGEKGISVDLSDAGFFRSGSSELTVLHRLGRGRTFGARLVERRPEDVWRTSITVQVPEAGDGWCLIEVSSDRGRPAAVPRIASYVIDVAGAYDGMGRLHSAPVTIAEPRVEELIDILCDADRRGVAFVAGTDGSLPFDAFLAQVGRWTRDVRGLAQVFVLDPPATSRLAEKLGTAHQSVPWALRTYLPDVDPASASDGRRHRILGTSRLVTQRDAVTQRLLGWIARRHALASALPPDATRTLRDLRRAEDRLLVDALASQTQIVLAPADSPDRVTRQADLDQASAISPRSGAVDGGVDVSGYAAQLDLVRSVLGVFELDEEGLQKIAAQARRGRITAEALDRVTIQLEERQSAIDTLQDELENVRYQYEDEEIELAISDQQRSDLADENRWLRGRLAQLQAYDAAYGTMPETESTHYPQSFVDLLDRLPELEPLGVVFTGDPDDVLDLVANDSLQKAVRAAWECLLALVDYIRSRNEGLCNQGLAWYLEHTPDGYRTVPPGRRASGETRRTMAQWGGERVFRVPEGIDSSGHATMEAHFRLGRIGMVSPRMYYLDSWAKDGRVYVGYLGAHLTNTQTN